MSAAEIEQQEIFSSNTDKYSAAFRRLMASRGCFDDNVLSEYLRRDRLFSESPFDICQMKEAVDLLKSSLREKKKIYIFSDSDIDGLTSLTIVRNLFDKIGFDYSYDFPKGNERFGLNKRAVEEAAQKGCEIILTLDCGIRDNEIIEYAAALGIQVIICDHHDPSEDLPDALIVNPKMKNSKYPYRELAGCGVALLLCAAFLYSYLPAYDKEVLFISNGESYCSKNLSFEKIGKLPSDLSKYIIVSESIEEKTVYDCADYILMSKMFSSALINVKSRSQELYLEFLEITDVKTKFIFSSLMSSKKIMNFLFDNLPFAAIGTVADVVPVLDANRSIVFCGLILFEKSDLPQIIRLRSQNKTADSAYISWVVAPLLNSPGRFGESELTADFLYGIDTEVLYKKISDINRIRKNHFKTAIESAEECVDNSYENIVLYYSEDVPEGITGIIASRISEMYKKPAVAAVKAEDGIIKASARSFLNTDILSHAEKFSDMFLRFGGHPSAFGFSISESSFKDFLNKFDQDIIFEFSDSPIRYDCVIREEEISLAFADELKNLSPFGKNNEQPVFLCQSLIPDSYQEFGEHAKIRCSSDIDFIGWKMKDTLRLVHEKRKADLIVKIEKNIFNNRMSARAIIERIL
ncbi:MAG TPA: DHHA1 domain-containing protein [Spirochaetota bacterium]|nr:DHHA1 domain-containing protein [Spirochaetota bacterium]HOR43331.1 DHHA1 domain-containing protein [Spirochaetota bacterium]HPK54920.1 DHHA1 domain-containing protein [Spirochaetota bacterium]